LFILHFITVHIGNSSILILFGLRNLKEIKIFRSIDIVDVESKSSSTLSGKIYLQILSIIEAIRDFQRLSNLAQTFSRNFEILFGFNRLGNLCSRLRFRNLCS